MNLTFKNKLLSNIVIMSAVASMSVTAYAVDIRPLSEGVIYDANSVIIKYKSPKDRSQSMANDELRNSIQLTLESVIETTGSQNNKAKKPVQFNSIFEESIVEVTFSGMSVDKALKALNNHPDVLYAEPNYRVHMYTVPNDPKFNQLWGLNNTGQKDREDDNGKDGVSGADIDVLKAWETTTGLDSVVVGIIDTGIDYTHEDLKANMWVNPKEIAGNGIDDDNNGYIDDIHGISAVNNNGNPKDTQGHGTHVAGTIGATGNNNIGISGVNQKIKLVGCQFLGEEGGNTSDAIECLNYMSALKDSGVNIVATNNSWGGGGYSKALKDAIDGSIAKGMVFVAAAGNSRLGSDILPGYPGDYDSAGIISVASSNNQDKLSSFSNFGLYHTELAAPGENILSTLPNNKYERYSGTSMAAPHVSGAIALLKSVDNSLTVEDVKSVLSNSGDAVASMKNKLISGKRLNVANALADIDKSIPFRLDIDLQRQSIVQGDTATYNITVRGDSNTNVVLEVESDLADVSLSKANVTTGDVIVMTINTDNTTTAGLHNIKLKGETGNKSKSVSTSIFVTPKEVERRRFGDKSFEILSVADGVTDIINIPLSVTGYDFQVSVDTSVNNFEKLILLLTSPSGDRFLLHRFAEHDESRLIKSYTFPSLNGIDVKGDWKMTAVYTEHSNDAASMSWNVSYNSTDKQTPTAPEAKFNFEAKRLKIVFFDKTTDINNNVDEWLWDFGDGTNSTEQSPSHSYAVEGDYTVTLTVTDDTDFTSTKSQKIEVLNYIEPTPSFEVTYNDKKVTFTNTSTDPDTVIDGYKWDFGDGNSSLEKSPVHEYEKEEEFNVSLTIMYKNGKTKIVNDKVKIILMPDAKFSYTIDGLTVSFKDLSSNQHKITKREWVFDSNSENSEISTEKNPVYTYKKAGDYQVWYSVTSSDFTIATRAFITVKEKEVVIPTVSFDYTVKNRKVSFVNTSTNTVDVTSIMWDFGDGNSSSNSSVTHYYEKKGTYNVSLTLTLKTGKKVVKAQSIQVGKIKKRIVAKIHKTKIYKNGNYSVVLKWTGAKGKHVDLYRNNMLIETTKNDGQFANRIKYPESLKNRFNYKVCEQNTQKCSKKVKVKFENPPLVAKIHKTKIYKNGNYSVVLKWTGAKGTHVDLYRNNMLIETTKNDGQFANRIKYPENLKNRFNYKVCEENTQKCSKKVKVKFETPIEITEPEPIEITEPEPIEITESVI